MKDVPEVRGCPPPPRDIRTVGKCRFRRAGAELAQRNYSREQRSGLPEAIDPEAIDSRYTILEITVGILAVGLTDGAVSMVITSHAVNATRRPGDSSSVGGIIMLISKGGEEKIHLSQ